MEIVRPGGWPRPKGYSDAVAASGKVIFVSGQVGWDAQHQFHSDDIVAQVRQALENIATLLRASDARPEHVARLTWYVIDTSEYLKRSRDIGEAYRAVMGSHYPAMSVVQVAALVEPAALVEIEATAVVPA